MKSFLTLICCIWISTSVVSQVCFTCDDAPAGTIFCDDFESAVPLSDRYFESGGNIFQTNDAGRDSTGGIRVVWNEGAVGVGGFKKSFGKTPSNYIGNHAVNPEQDFDEIYWRIDLRMQPGWQGGGPAKLSRAMTLANSNWAQGMIAHIWTPGPGPNSEYLVMDPASGIDTDGNLVSTGYNDFANLRWLGAKLGNIDVFSTANSGKWYCIEAHAKLNSPGNSDGIFEFWVNDTLQNGAYDLNWHGDWNADPQNLKINAIFIENYWNDGSPVTQERYIDNFVISTNRIGCECANTTSVIQTNQVNTVIVYPNPANNFLNIKVGKEIAMNGYVLEIFDATGQSALKTGTIKKLVFSQDLNHYTAGNYFYRITNNSALLKSGSFIVQKN
jgi:hypothetical protein